jgi:DNA-binding response OmpR family regulator
VRHVLVADDEPHIGRIIQMKLEQGPFRVTLAYDGREALEALENADRIDLVPARSHDAARQRARRARAPPRRPTSQDLPCIILTAAGQDMQYRQAMALGATDFMTKPFSPKKLYARAAELAGIADGPGRRRSEADPMTTSPPTPARWAVVLAGGVGSRFCR